MWVIFRLEYIFSARGAVPPAAISLITRHTTHCHRCNFNINTTSECSSPLFHSPGVTPKMNKCCHIASVFWGSISAGGHILSGKSCNYHPPPFHSPLDPRLTVVGVTSTPATLPKTIFNLICVRWYFVYGALCSRKHQSMCCKNTRRI